MSHMLEKHDHVFLAGKPAWHGIGTVTDGVRTAAEAIQIAKLNWQTLKDRIYRFKAQDMTPDAIDLVEQLEAMGYGVNIGKLRALQAYSVTVRDDLDFDNPASDLGVVGESYQEIGNAQCFDLVDRVVGRIGAEYETAGSLMNGKQIFLLARCPKDLQVGSDKLRPYILLSTAHDGSKALEVKMSLIRVVCWNTMSAALSDASTATVRIKHTSGAVDSSGKVRASLIDDVRQGIQANVEQKAREGVNGSGELVASVTDYLGRQARIFNQLADAFVTRDFVRDYFHTIIPQPIKGSKTRADNKRQSIADVYFGVQPGDDQDVMRIDRETGSGTAYRIYNAITHWNDHIANNRQTIDKGTGERKSFAESRFTRIMNTKGFREESLDILCEAVDSKGKTLKDALQKNRELRNESLQRALITN